jgi:hypothetical protein
VSVVDFRTSDQVCDSVEHSASLAVCDNAKHPKLSSVVLLVWSWWVHRIVRYRCTRKQQQVQMQMQKREASETVAFLALQVQVPERVRNVHIMLPDTARCNAIQGRRMSIFQVTNEVKFVCLFAHRQPQ